MILVCGLIVRGGPLSGWKRRGGLVRWCGLERRIVRGRGDLVIVNRADGNGIVGWGARGCGLCGRGCGHGSLLAIEGAVVIEVGGHGAKKVCGGLEQCNPAEAAFRRIAKR